jgi:hypothetical protein
MFTSSVVCSTAKCSVLVAGILRPSPTLWLAPNTIRWHNNGRLPRCRQQPSLRKSKTTPIAPDNLSVLSLSGLHVNACGFHFAFSYVSWIGGVPGVLAA